MTLNEQLSGNFPKTLDRSSREFSALVTNSKGTGALQSSIQNLLDYMKSWCATPDIYKQTGTMLRKTLAFFSFLEPFPDETEQSIKNRFGAVFVRNHDTKWGTPYDIKSVFKQYFPNADIYLIENTNKIDDDTPEYANLLEDGDIDNPIPVAWTINEYCSIDTAARFSKAYGVMFDRSGGMFSQTVNIPTTRHYTTPVEEDVAIPYYLHFFLGGTINVQIKDSSDNYWDFTSKTWKDSVINNSFTNKEWNNSTLYFIPDTTNEEETITISFSYNGVVASDLGKPELKGELPPIWTLTDCTTTGNVIHLSNVSSTVSKTVSIIPEETYNLNFDFKGRVAVIIKNNNDKYWNAASEAWTDEMYTNNYISNTWKNNDVIIIPDSADSSVTITIQNAAATPSDLENITLQGEIPSERTLTDCTTTGNLVNLTQLTSVASYEADVLAGNTYSYKIPLNGRLSVVVENDNNEYWDFSTNLWKANEVSNEFTSNTLTEKELKIIADNNTTHLTITYTITPNYADYFRLFAKQPYGSFTVIAHFIGYTASGVFGLAAGDDDPNDGSVPGDTPPQPRYGNYGYYDKSFLSGVPVGFAKDIYEDLLDYLRAQGVRAYLDILIKDYVENE